MNTATLSNQQLEREIEREPTAGIKAPWDVDFEHVRGPERREVWEEARQAVLELESWGFVGASRSPAEWCWYLDDPDHWPVLRVLLVLGKDCREAGVAFAKDKDGALHPVFDASEKRRQLEGLNWFWHNFAPLRTVLQDQNKETNRGPHDSTAHRIYGERNRSKREPVPSFQEVVEGMTAAGK